MGRCERMHIFRIRTIHTHSTGNKKFKINMCSGPILPKMLLFAVPLMFSSILQLLFNAADIIVVGRYAGGQFACGGRLEYGAHRAADEPLHRRIDRDERPRRALLRCEGREGAFRNGAHIDVPRRRERNFPDARRRRIRAQNFDNHADSRRGARPCYSLSRYILLRHDADDDL